MQKSIMFSNTNNEQVNLNLKHITIYVLPKIKHLDIHLRKYVQGLYEENYKILMKETKN